MNIRILWIGVGILILVGVAFIFKGDFSVFNKSNNLDQKSQCATQAQNALSTFKQTIGPGYIDFEQQNHYNSNSNKCFVLIIYSQDFVNGPLSKVNKSAQMDGPLNMETLMNAYENTSLADCSYFLNRPGIDLSNPETYTLCNIGNTKVSYAQYKDFINQNMGPIK